ncbi:MAG: TolC family protein [Deltaproteobacteria bacterium]|nr:TolC family protein [Deltaproteobacteria bacterium]
MLRTTNVLLALMIMAAPVLAQYQSSSQYGTSGIQAPSVSSQTAPAVLPPALRPQVNIPVQATSRFEQNPVLSIPQAFGRQWWLGSEVPPEALISERYLRTQDTLARRLTLKEAVYIAIRNNPGLTAVQLDPIAAEESVKFANAAFDPDLTSQLDVSKSVAPVSSPFQVAGSKAFTTKNYDWNFAINKVSAYTNGTLGITFDNNRTLSNSNFAAVNPSYTPLLEASLVQPLLRNFGWKFATLNVSLAESAQKTTQWNYGSSLNDFIQRIGNDYWGVVQAQENLRVAESALKFNNDLVRVNRISLQVGTLAPIDLQEAQSAAATAEANVYAAEAALKTARAQLRQDVMLNPAGTFVPEDVEPAEAPNPNFIINETEETALERMVQYSPALGGMREAIRTALLQVKFDENQTLPQLNIGAQFGTTGVAGTTPCIQTFSSTSVTNCTIGKTRGAQLPFRGIYGDALERLYSFGFYNYAAVLSFEMPLDNAAAKAALAQARVAYEQSRMQYRAALSQAVVQVESAIANLHAFEKQVEATRKATFYAEQSLHDEQVEFRVGMATTHDLLQYQEELVTAQGNEVQADVGLENARLALWHAEGTLTNIFNIDFQVQDPRVAPWYTKF